MLRFLRLYASVQDVEKRLSESVCEPIFVTRCKDMLYSTNQNKGVTFVWNCWNGRLIANNALLFLVRSLGCTVVSGVHTRTAVWGVEGLKGIVGMTSCSSLRVFKESSSGRHSSSPGNFLPPSVSVLANESISNHPELSQLTQTAFFASFLTITITMLKLGYVFLACVLVLEAYGLHLGSSPLSPRNIVSPPTDYHDGSYYSPKPAEPKDPYVSKTPPPKAPENPEYGTVKPPPSPPPTYDHPKYSYPKPPSPPPAKPELPKYNNPPKTPPAPPAPKPELPKYGVPKYEPPQKPENPKYSPPKYEPPHKPENPKYNPPKYEPPHKSEDPKYEPPHKSEDPKYEPPHKSKDPKYEPPHKSEDPKYEPPHKSEDPKYEHPHKKEQKPDLYTPPQGGDYGH
ncbi:hypothetical protein VP01_886g3 [Puccinia sorghi]|uniref:Uncharacterized protein n=1 Tax=Puccinia sorghi TaxID=27349 RepID=A0A0L6U884_9BASI|nr:hypothetical protein VP01_886g3 [Puccinia sorghi]